MCNKYNPISQQTKTPLISNSNASIKNKLLRESILDLFTEILSLISFNFQLGMIGTFKKIVNYKMFYSFSNGKNYYDLLQVTEGAAFKEIKEKYLAKSKLYHPDVTTGSEDHYHLIQQAYKILISPQQRKKYDLSLGIQHSLWQKQLTNHQFNDKFQSQAFEQLLKGTHNKNHQPMNSLEEKLQQLFKTEIQTNNKVSSLFTNFNFMASLACIGIAWLGWTLLQTVFLNYKGEAEHEVTLARTDITLKVVPLVTR